MKSLFYPLVLVILAAVHCPKLLEKWPHRCHWTICLSYLVLAAWFIVLFALGIAEAH